MKRIPPVVSYTVLRLLAFLIPLAILLLLRIDGWIAAILAALIGMSVSYITLRRQRDEVALALYEKRHGSADAEREADTSSEDSDEEAEDRLS